MTPGEIMHRSLLLRDVGQLLVTWQEANPGAEAKIVMGIRQARILFADELEWCELHLGRHSDATKRLREKLTAISDGTLTTFVVYGAPVTIEGEDGFRIEGPDAMPCDHSLVCQHCGEVRR